MFIKTMSFLLCPLLYLYSKTPFPFRLLHCLLTSLTAAVLHSQGSTLNTSRTSIMTVLSFMICDHLEIFNNFWTNDHVVSFYTEFYKLCTQPWIHPIRLFHKTNCITSLFMTLQRLLLSFRVKGKSPTVASTDPHDAPLHTTPTSLITYSITLPFIYSLIFLKHAQSISSLGPLHSCLFWLLHSYLNIAWLVLVCFSSHIIIEAFSNHSR